MKRILLVLLVAMFLSGCTKAFKTPLRGGASFSECNISDCVLDISFPVDSIIAIEGGTDARAIYFGGKIFLLGNGFSNLWIGELNESEVSFKKVALIGIPTKKMSFDWEHGLLLLSWVGPDDIQYRWYVNSKGDFVEEK